MNNLKVKVIGVLRERETARQGQSGRGRTQAGGAAGTGRPANGQGGDAAAAEEGTFSRQLSKMSAMDLAGILNCRRRLEWTKDWLRKNEAEFQSKENLMKEIQFRSNETYYLNCFLDIKERQFRYLVKKLAPVISSLKPQRKKKPFSAEERLSITLKYLATGEYHSCRNYCFLASKSVILKMISDICLYIYELLKDQFLTLPKTDEQWQTVADEWRAKRKLPNCLGNLAMNEIKLSATPRSREALSHASRTPLIFTAIVDSNNHFMYADIEQSKATSHDEIYEHSTFNKLIDRKTIALPKHDEVQDVSQSYYFAGCGALPAKTYIMNSMYYVPTSDELSCMFSKIGMSEFDFCRAMDFANLHIKNAMCAMCNIFPVLLQPLRMDAEHARKITLGCVALYNFLRKTDTSFYERTEKINVVNNDDNEDDDCILVLNEEEQRERNEYTPVVAVTSCFEQLQKQKHATAAGLAKRDRLMQYMDVNNLYN